MKQNTRNELPTAPQTLEGTTVELFDGAVSLGFATMTGPTTWSKQVSALSVDSHVFVARQASGLPVSAPWTVTVLTPLSGVKTSIRSLP